VAQEAGFKEEKTMTGRMSRNKGAAAEREFCNLLSDHLGEVVQRKLGQARDAGVDVHVGKFRFEVKRRETLSLPAWCRQAELACMEDPANLVPVVAYRTNGQQWRVVLLLEDFLPLLAGELAGE
jgi:Holliday junction resolvase